MLQVDNFLNVVLVCKNPLNFHDLWQMRYKTILDKTFSHQIAVKMYAKWEPFFIGLNGLNVYN